MKKAPTEQQRNADIEDRLDHNGSTFTVSIENVERVREHDDLGSLLGALTNTAQAHAHRHPDDPIAAQLESILWATSAAYRDQSKHGERGELARAFLTKLEGLAGSAAHQLDKTNQGPRTLKQEGGMLCNCIAADIGRGATPRQMAENVVARVRISPRLAKYTNVPVAGRWVGTDAEERDTRAVELAIMSHLDPTNPDVKAIARATLRALGCSTDDATNRVAHWKPKS